jgi:hypothetical protein
MTIIAAQPLYDWLLFLHVVRALQPLAEVTTLGPPLSPESIAR